MTSFGGFDFRDNILPLAPSGDNDLPGAQGEVRHVSMWHGRPFCSWFKEGID